MTRAEIDAARTPLGGWTKAQLAEWGVSWPPQKGWKAALIAMHCKARRPVNDNGESAGRGFGE